jgi:hypothetical protein
VQNVYQHIAFHGTQKHDGIIEPLNLPQRFFAVLHPFFTTTSRNLARLKIDRSQNVICDSLLCQVISVEMWPISKAFDVISKACLK